MIVTGPLSMTLSSSIQSDLSDEKHGVGMRIVDVFADEKGKFTHEWKLLDEDKPFMDTFINKVSVVQRFRRRVGRLSLTDISLEEKKCACQIS